MEISVVLAEWLKNQVDLTDAKRDVLIYGLNIILSSLIGYACIIGISYLLQIHFIVIPMLLIHSLLRCFSGGAHGSKLIYCVSFSVIIFNAMGLILNYILSLSILDTPQMIIINFMIFLVGLYYINMKVPVDVKEKPITSQSQRERLKKCSYGVLLIWYGIVFFMTLLTGTKYQTVLMALSMGILWQLITLTNWGEKLIETYGKVLTRIGI